MFLTGRNATNWRTFTKSWWLVRARAKSQLFFLHFLNTLWFMLCYSLNIEIGSHFSFASGGAVYRHFNMHSLWLDCTIKHNSTEIWPHFPHEISPYYTRTNSKVFAPCMLNIYGQLEHVLYLKLALLFKNKIRGRSKP